MMKLKGITHKNSSTSIQSTFSGVGTRSRSRDVFGSNITRINMKKERRQFDSNKHYTVTEKEDMCTLHHMGNKQEIRRPSAPPLHHNNTTSRRANEIWVSSTRSSAITTKDENEINGEEREENNDCDGVGEEEDTLSEFSIQSIRYIECEQDFDAMCKINSTLRIVDKTIKKMSRLKEALKWGSASFCVIACSVLIICLL